MELCKKEKAAQFQVHGAQELKASAPIPSSHKVDELPSANSFNTVNLKFVIYKMGRAMIPILYGHCKH